MGSYAQVTIGGYPIFSTKNYYDQWFFRKKDRVIRTRTKAERNTLIWSEAEPHEKHEEEADYLYVCSGSVLCRRLELAGYNRDALEQEFNKCIARRIANLEELSNYEDSWAKKYAQRIPILKSSRLADWLKALKIAVDNGISSSWRWDDYQDNHNNPLLHLLFSHDEFTMDEPSMHETGFPCETLESMAVAMLEIMPKEVECSLDITDLIGGGWTDSFDDLIDYHNDCTTFYEVFATAIEDIRSLTDLSPESKTLARLLYANVITAMETYLSDTLKKQVLTRESIRRRFVQTNDAFKNKFTVQDTFRKLDSLNEDIVQAIDMMSFHNLDKTTGLYKSVLDTQFPDARMEALKEAVENRHDIVHRNGKTAQGKVVNVSMEDVLSLIGLVDQTVKYIDQQIKDGLLDDDEEDQ